MRHTDVTVRRGHGRPVAGFTLVELLVVLGIIGLVAALILPSVAGMVTQSGDWQAYNILAGQLTSARGLAMEKGTYAGVHVQIADAGPDLLADVCFSAVVSYSRTTQKFSLADGFRPVRLPANYAFGRLAGYTEDYDGGTKSRYIDTFSDLPAFTTLTIVFGPAGQIVSQVDGGSVRFDADGKLFAGGTRLWDHSTADNKLPVRFMAMFDYRQLKLRAPGAARQAYLNETGEFLAINLFTGQLFERK